MAEEDPNVDIELTTTKEKENYVVVFITETPFRYILGDLPLTTNLTDFFASSYTNLSIWNSKGMSVVKEYHILESAYTKIWERETFHVAIREATSLMRDILKKEQDAKYGSIPYTIVGVWEGHIKMSPETYIYSNSTNNIQLILNMNDFLDDVASNPISPKLIFAPERNINEDGYSFGGIEFVFPDKDINFETEIEIAADLGTLNFETYDEDFGYISIEVEIRGDLLNSGIYYAYYYWGEEADAYVGLIADQLGKGDTNSLEYMVTNTIEEADALNSNPDDPIIYVSKQGIVRDAIEKCTETLQNCKTWDELAMNCYDNDAW